MSQLGHSSAAWPTASPPGTPFPHTKSEPRAVLRSGEAVARRCELGPGLRSSPAGPQGRWTPPFLAPKRPTVSDTCGSALDGFSPWTRGVGCSGARGETSDFGIILEVQKTGKGRAESFRRLLNGFPSRSRSGEARLSRPRTSLVFRWGRFPAPPSVPSSTSRRVKAAHPLRFSI